MTCPVCGGAGIVARVEALADEWDQRPGIGDYITLTQAVDELRAALRPPTPCPVCGGAGIVDTSPPGVEERP